MERDRSYYRELVRVYIASGQTRRALDQATRNIAYNTDDPDAYIDRAAVYIKLGALENALEDLNEALKIDPDNTKALDMIKGLGSEIIEKSGKSK